LKGSIYFLFLKTGFITPDEIVSVTKIEPKYSRGMIVFKSMVAGLFFVNVKDVLSAYDWK